MWALNEEQQTGEFVIPTRNVYTQHAGMCMDHLTMDVRRKFVATAPAPDPAPEVETAPDPGQYVKIWAPDHPLATRSGMVLEHRAVLHDDMGDEPVFCHWCDEPLDWDAVVADVDEVTVDHLDWDRRNNDPGNLVPACRPCNAGRHAPKPSAVPAVATPRRRLALVEPDTGSEQGQTAPTADTADPHPKVESGGWAGRAYEASQASLSWLRDHRAARVALILVGLFLLGSGSSVAGLAWVADAVPWGGSTVGSTVPTSTTVLEPVTSLPPAGSVVEVQPTAAPATSSTLYVMPPPCLPGYDANGASRCPSLDD
jgi:hypothetical protein